MVHEGARNDLRGMEPLIDQLPPRFTEWQLSPEPGGQDTVIGWTFLRHISGDNKEARLLVTRWLGPECAFGEVRYSARDLERGPLVLWRAGAEDVVLYDPVAGGCLTFDPEPIGRLALVLPQAIPCKPEIWEPRASPPGPGVWEHMTERTTWLWYHDGP